MSENVENYQFLTYSFILFLKTNLESLKCGNVTHCGSLKNVFFFKSPEDLYILCRQKVSLYLFYRLETESSENVTDWPKNDPSACAQFCKNVPLYQGLMMVSSEHSCSVVLFLGFEI